MNNLSLLEGIFFAALEKGPAQARAAFLDEACAGDLDLRRRVEKMLAAQSQAGSFLESPPPGLGPTLDEPISERPGAVIGPYKLLEQIGEGGFGVVFMAEQTQPVRRRVALKILKPGMDTRQVVARFEAERQALAIMDHPNIAKVFDGGSTGSSEPRPSGSGCGEPLPYGRGSERPYFVMELVKGVPITEFCDQNHLTSRQRLELFVNVCQAVQHAHQKGIIHRDLKPSNILVSRHDSTPVVKVIDFGVAKALGQELTDKTLFTGIAQMIGTPLYMSPEQAGMSDLDIDTRSDIYSLGVLLYELLTGTTPFSKERFKQAAYDEIRRIIREEEPPKPSTRLSDTWRAEHTSPSAERRVQSAESGSLNGKGASRSALRALRFYELDWIVMKCLEKDRNRRYETASGLAADLERYLHDEPVQACPPSAGYRFRKFARRNKAKLTTVALVSTALVVGTAVASWQAIRATDAMHSERAIQASLDTARAEKDQERSRTNRELSSALVEAARLREQAKAPGSKGKEHWAQLRDTVRRAETLAGSDLADALLVQQIHSLRAEVNEEIDDRQLIARIEAAQLGQTQENAQSDPWQRDPALPMYQTAFRAYGFDPSSTSAEQAAARIRSRSADVQAVIVAGLDDWHNLEIEHSDRSPENKQRRGWVRAVIAAADYDPWRTQVRAAVKVEDYKALAELAAEADLHRHAPFTLVLTANQLRSKAPWREAGINLLRRAQQTYPADFWVNASLMRALNDSEDSPPQDLVRFANVAVALRPDSSEAWHTLGVACFRADKLQEAEIALRKTIALAPDDDDAYANLGTILSKKGQHQEALTFFRQALALRPDDGQTYFSMATAFIGLGQYDEVIDACRKAIERIPDYALAHSNLAYALGKKGRWEEAVPHCRKAIQLKPKLAAPYFDLGNAFWHKDQWDEAMPHYRKTLELQPDHGGAHSNLGTCLMMKGRFAEAASSYRAAIKHSPKDVDSYNNFAWFFATCADVKFRDPAQAVALAKKAVHLEPTNGGHWNTLGVAHYRAADWKQATTTLQRSMELKKSGNSFDWFFLAMAHWRLDQKEEAHKRYDQAVQWMQKNAPRNEELRRFRTEAEELLGIKSKP